MSDERKYTDQEYAEAVSAAKRLVATKRTGWFNVPDLLACLLEEREQLLKRAIPEGACTYCRGIGSDPMLGTDVPCGSCGGSGRE